MGLDIHWRRQFFLDVASRFAMRAAPADFVANFKILGSHNFFLTRQLLGEASPLFR